jgi:hypothetical protein
MSIEDTKTKDVTLRTFITHVAPYSSDIFRLFCHDTCSNVLIQQIRLGTGRNRKAGQISRFISLHAPKLVFHAPYSPAWDDYSHRPIKQWPSSFRLNPKLKHQMISLPTLPKQKIKFRSHTYGQWLNGCNVKARESHFQIIDTCLLEWGYFIQCALTFCSAGSTLLCVQVENPFSKMCPLWIEAREKQFLIMPYAQAPEISPQMNLLLQNSETRQSFSENGRQRLRQDISIAPFRDMIGVFWEASWKVWSDPYASLVHNRNQQWFWLIAKVW